MEDDEDRDFEMLFCSICQVKLSSIRAYMAHCSGLSHVQKKAMKECPAIPVANPSEPARPPQPAASLQQPGAPQQRPGAPLQRPAAPQQGPGAPLQRPATPQQRPGAPLQRPAAPLQRPAAPQQRPAAPQQRPGAPQQWPATPQLRPTVPLQRPAAPQQRPGAPQQWPATPQLRPTVPLQRPAAPQQRPGAPQQWPAPPIIGPVRPPVAAAAPGNKAASNEHDEFYCEFCDVQLADTRSYLTHCSTLLHSQKRAVMEKPQMDSTFKAIESKPRKPLRNGPMYESLKPFIPKGPRQRRFTVEDFEFNMLNCSYCTLCEIACSGIECFRTHCAGNKHCKKFLVRQNELGFEQFNQLFRNLLYDKEDEEEPPPDIDDDYIIHCYRSGVHNNLKCRACGRTLFSYQAWYDHVLGEDHALQMIELLEVHGGPAFMNMFGDLPGPNPLLIKAGLMNRRPAIVRKRRKEKEIKVDAVQEVTDSTPRPVETYSVPTAVPSGNMNAGGNTNSNGNVNAGGNTNAGGNVKVVNASGNTNAGDSTNAGDNMNPAKKANRNITTNSSSSMSQNNLFRRFVLGSSANAAQNTNQSTNAAANVNKSDAYTFAKWKEPTSVSDPSLMPMFSPAATSLSQPAGATAADNYSGYGVYTSVNSAAMWSMPYQTNAYNSAAMAAAYSNMYGGMVTDPSVYWTASAVQAQTQLSQPGSASTTTTTVSQATQPAFMPGYPMYNYAQAMQGVWPQVGTSDGSANSTMPAYWTSAYTNFQQPQ